MAQRLSLFTLVVRDYDEALAFYVGKLGFRCVEDTDLGDGKRWVRVRPGGSGPDLLLARAVTDEQRARVGDQTGGRVGAFLETDDVARDYQAFLARGVRFARGPLEESYGTVAVLEDPYGNLLDLIQPTGVRALIEALGLPPPPAHLEASVRPLQATDEWTVKRVEYRGDEDDLIPALLFLPTGAGPFAGVVAFHQHNSEWHLGKSEVAGLAGAPTQAFAPALARRGLAVLAPDVLTFEERRKSGRGTEPHERDWLEHYNELAHRLVRGELVLRKHLSDAMRALTVLAAQPEVDRSRIGVVGHSMGGTLALHHAAVDPRVAFGCASGSVSSLASRIARGVGIGMMEVIPDAATRWPTASLLAEAARIPFLVASSPDDRFSADADEVVRDALRECERRGRIAKIEHFRVAGPHPLDEARFDAIVDWVARHA